MRQKIIKLGEGQFRVFWEKHESQALKLDFRPLLKQLQLKFPAVLLHWQGKPYGLRRWGVYCSSSDQYYGVDFNKLDLGNCQSRTHQIPERQFKTLPTAVLVYPNCKILAKGDYVKLVKPEI